MRRWICAGAVSLLVACGVDGADADTDQGAPAPPVSPSADGWSSAYVEGGVRISCDDGRAELASSDAPRVEVDDAVIFVGYEQVGDNQNPIVVRFDADAQTWCVRHETEGPELTSPSTSARWPWTAPTTRSSRATCFRPTSRRRSVPTAPTAPRRSRATRTPGGLGRSRGAREGPTRRGRSTSRSAAVPCSGRTTRTPIAACRAAPGSSFEAAR